MVDSSVVGYDGARKVRDEEQSVGRKKRVRKAEPSKRPPKQRAQSEQKPRSRWQSIKNQVVRTAKVAAGPLITVLDLVVVLSAISMIWLLWRDVITVPVTNHYGLRGVLTVGGILILIGIGYRYEWTGFVARDREKSETGEIQRRKTLWDWMTLLLVPVMIAGIAPWFTLWQNNSQRTLEAQQRAQEAENRAQSAALQDYLGQMSQLIKEDGLQQSDEGDTVFTLAQARTITTIRQLDGGRNQIVTRFLTELGLLRVPALLAKVNLEGAELAKAELQEANLVGTQLNRANLAGALLINADFSAENQIIQANLTKADLSKAALLGADLSGCFLKEATLTDATLQSAKLRSADLRGADLSRAALQGADLSAESPFEGPFPQDAPLRFLKRSATNLTDGDLSNAALQEADLRNAVLQNANLTNADLTNTNFTDAYLSNANLTDAEGWTMEQLTAARSLEGATMPNRQKYEDWLKSRGEGDSGS